MMMGRGLKRPMAAPGIEKTSRFLHAPTDLQLKMTMCSPPHHKGLVGDLDIGFISGCEELDTDYSADVTDPETGESYGAFSHYLFPLLVANRDKSLKEIGKMVCDALAADGFDQRPMVSDMPRSSKPFLV
jgi:hypothetical protein